MGDAGLNWANATCAHGPSLVDWIQSRRPRAQLEDWQRQALRRWSDGGQARHGTVDRLLHSLDLQLSEVPDAVWRRYDNGRRGRRNGTRRRA